MKPINGKTLADSLALSLASTIRQEHLRVGLAIILVGTDPSSQTYVRLKKNAAEKLGIQFSVYSFSKNVAQQTLEEVIDWLNTDEDINGIIIQLPLPKHLDEEALIKRIDPKKDADGFHNENVEAYLAHHDGAKPPGLIEGILLLLHQTNEDLRGKKAVILANSKTFSDPLAESLRRESVEPSVHLHDLRKGLHALREADIIIVAVGKKHCVNKSHVKPGSIIIDVGFTRSKGKVYGDVDSESLRDCEGFVTPVPGGVGPMTVIMLLKRVIELAKTPHA